DVSQSAFAVHAAPTVPVVQKLQSALPLRRSHSWLSSSPPVQKPVSQSLFIEHFAPSSENAPSAQKLSSQSESTVQVSPRWVFSVVQMPPIWTTVSPQNVQSARQPFTPGGSQVSPRTGCMTLSPQKAG